MHFIIRMSLREFRSSWRRLLFFFLCVAIGVGAIVALRSVIQSLRRGLVSEARSMIASDVIVQTNRAWTPEVRRRVDEILSSAPVLWPLPCMLPPPQAQPKSALKSARRRAVRWRRIVLCMSSTIQARSVILAGGRVTHSAAQLRRQGPHGDLAAHEHGQIFRSETGARSGP